MKSALSSKVRENEIIVLDSLKLDEPKTKEMAKVLENVKAAKKALIVTDVKDENVVRSAANIPGVKTTIVGEMNVYDIVNHTSLILTKDAVTRIEEVYS
jgi:large subunit ribosomal protein L4